MTHGVDVDPAVVQGTDGDVVSEVLAAIAAGHGVDVDLGVVPRNVEIGIEPKATEAPDHALGPSRQLVGVSVDRLGHRGSQEMLTRSADRAPQPVVGIG